MNRIRSKAKPRCIVAIIAAATNAVLLNTHAEPVPPHGIVASTIGVQQLGFENPPENVIVTNQYAIGDFIVRPTANKGDYDVQIGEILSDDVEGGVLITSIAENGGRDNVDQFGSPDPVYPGINTATSHTDYSRGGANAGGYFIPIAMTYPNSAGTTVVEYNLNVGAAWFPYDQWLGAFIRNSGGTNGGVNELMNGSPALVLGTHFQDHGAGRSTVDLTTLGIHSQTDGVLLVTGAKNEDNFALSQANADGTWSVYSKDNGTDGTSLEQDPIAFVYIPRTNSLVVSGRFNGDGTIAISGGEFTITPLDIGQWELKIPGRLPANGVLLISPEGGQAQNRDNIVSYEANAIGDGWIIESRDLPNTIPPGKTMPILETPGAEPVASFVFIPGATPGFTVIPTNNVFTSENSGAATFTVNLDTAPTADVTIAVASDNVAEGTVEPSIITFTSADWNIPQTVTITGQDDAAADGAVSYSVTLAPAASVDSNYDGLDPANVTVVNLDNDGAFTVNPIAGLATTEAGVAATFTVRLDNLPTAEVTIALSSSNPSEATVFPESLSFTPENWQSEQTVTVTGVDDSIQDGDQPFSIVTAPAVSTDPFYSSKNPSDVAGINTDNDTASITVTPTSGLTMVEAGGTSSYSVSLGSQPAADVVIQVVSGDTSEATVNPSTLTFTAQNWNVEQAVTLIGVDDLVTDGNIEFTVTNTVSTTDPIYAAILPGNVTLTVLDNEAEIMLPSEGIIYGIGMPAIGIAGRVSLVDSNTPIYATATLNVALTANADPDDLLAIRNVGTGEGEISVADTNISYSGMLIGAFSGGEGSSPLIVNLTNTAPDAVAALLRSVTFENPNGNPSRALRSLAITLIDEDGGVSTAETTVRVGLLRRADFQEGADHGYGIYTGAADTELYELQADTPKPTGRGNAGLFIDWRDADNPNSGQILLRFDNLVGDAPGQVPTNAIIVSAELFLDINDSGDASPLHRMLVPWDPENETWNSIGGGVTPDDVRARVEYDSQIGVENGSGSTTIGNVWVSVTPDVQAWVSGGEANYGWVMPAWPLRLDGTGFSPSEAPNTGDRPRLRVLWLPQDSAQVASFRQDVDGYTGVVDTRLRQNDPDTEFLTTATMFVDAVVSAGDPNPEQVLLRFDNIVGTGEGQIPAGSRVEAAMLDISSVNNDAMGDGGLFYKLLQPWPELATWNAWMDGIQTNGVEATATSSVIAGNSSLNPDVQGGFLSFDLTADVQSWVSGSPNNGWMINPWPGGGNGWGLTTSEDLIERNRPRLRVFYTEGTGLPNENIILQSPALTSEGLQLRFNGLPVSSYDVLRADSLEAAWSKVGSTMTDSSGTATFTDTAANAQTGFYRVVRP